MGLVMPTSSRRKAGNVWSSGPVGALRLKGRLLDRDGTGGRIRSVTTAPPVEGDGSGGTVQGCTTSISSSDDDVVDTVGGRGRAPVRAAPLHGRAEREDHPARAAQTRNERLLLVGTL